MTTLHGSTDASPCGHYTTGERKKQFEEVMHELEQHIESRMQQKEMLIKLATSEGIL